MRDRTLAPAGRPGLLSRRTLFSLIPAPILSTSGLLTTSFAAPAAPTSDPLAEAALAVAEARDFDSADFGRGAW
jgi:hypothetical protein